MSFTQLEQCLADIKIWEKDLKTSAVATPDEVRSQFMHNVAPILKALVKASMYELGETFETLDDMDAAITELVGREGDFLQPETASDLSATLILGLFIADTISTEKIQLNDELMNKRLQDAVKLYRQNSNILLEQIKEITIDGEGEDSDDDDIHGQSEDSGEHDGRREGTSSEHAGRAESGDGDDTGDRLREVEAGTSTGTGTEIGTGDLMEGGGQQADSEESEGI
jgi:hypothetical protein